ncbi:MAG: DMT family transporter [Oligoflexia bacterium]|nr:DMT family transporter [Oligoflexia bacterium]
MSTMSRRLTDRPASALGWMAASAFGFSSMAIFVKRLAPELPQFELVFFRSLINFLLVLALMLMQREPLVTREVRRSWRVLLIRGVAGFGGVSCLFYSLSHLPLPIAMLLGWSSPIFVILFSHLFLKERLELRQFRGIALAFAGLLLLVNPQSDHAAGPWLIAVAIGVLGAAFAGGAYVAVRAATARVSVNLIVLWFMGTSTIFSLPLAASGFLWPSRKAFLELLLLGGFATFAQLAMTRAYRHAPAGIVSTMSLLNAAISAFFGWAIFGETLGWLQWFGMGLIAVGIGVITLRTKNPRPST